MTSGSGQNRETRSQTTQGKWRRHLDRLVTRYNATWDALNCLQPGGDWTKVFLRLKPQDVQGLGRIREDESEGRRVVSWIWLMTGVHHSTKSLDDGLDSAEMDKGQFVTNERSNTKLLMHRFAV